MQVRHSERGRLPNNILQSALSTLHSPNPHGTALFCTVPRNRIFLYRRQVYIFPRPTRNKGLGKPIRNQKSKIRKIHPSLHFRRTAPLCPDPHPERTSPEQPLATPGRIRTHIRIKPPEWE